MEPAEHGTGNAIDVAGLVDLGASPYQLAVYAVEAYQQLGYQFIELSNASLEERAAFIVDYIEDRV